MVDLSFNEDTNVIENLVRRFATETLSGNYRDFEANRLLPAPVLSTYAEMDLTHLEAPKSLGGAGLVSVAKTVLLKELGSGLPGAMVLAQPLMPLLMSVVLW